MAALTKQQLIGRYPATPVTAEAADITFAATDLAGDTFVNTGREIILVRNDDAAPQTLTITSAASEKNRTGDIDVYSVGIGEYAAFGPFPPAGWNDAASLLNLLSSDVDLMIAILELPAGIV